jgi:8-oxo-dGDP phosphatase
MSGFRRTEEREVHRGYLWRVVVAQFTAPDGSPFQRDVVRSPGAVGALPVEFDPEGRPVVTLVRQYRAAFEAELVELPAGMRDVPGEDPSATAHRELAEEVGLLAGRMEHLGDIYPSPGMTDAVTSLYVATELTSTVQDTHGPEEDHLEVFRVGLDDALAMIDDGRIVDAKTVTALLLLARRLAAADRRG